ncbi:MAG TPA: acyl-CoA carboxylase subunit epsilon [Dermatophilaceae bacterium]|jgi:hypothetical protein|nr:acyl-CoA carboxylase subunit epsilon [Actinomycetales bacterium]HMT90871.1 acyl-CoA carboxylase subunit epsilon [Dermatophilaceae bacterium]
MSSNAASDPSATSDAPVIRIVHGSPSAQDLGILVAVLSAVGGGEGGGGGAPASHWSAPASRLVPVGPRTAPSAWRWSGMPR